MENNYHVTGKFKSTLYSWGKCAREGNSQRDSIGSGQEELIIHEEVVGKDFVFSCGHKGHHHLWKREINKLHSTSFSQWCFV